MSNLTSSQNETLEIEHKFLYDFDIEKKLAELGATFLNNTANESDLIITDEYFDNLKSHFLILNDCWLRTRAKNSVTKWQLKYPSKRISNESENFDNYIEIENQDEIQKFISDLAQNYFSEIKTPESFDNFLKHSLELKPFCLINSKRKSYLLDKVRIDLDETDFGFNCGELEVMVSKNASSEQIQASIESIHETASKLGKLNYL
jgi:adenylate cyclase class IV